MLKDVRITLNGDAAGQQERARIILGHFGKHHPEKVQTQRHTLIVLKGVDEAEVKGLRNHLKLIKASNSEDAVQRGLESRELAALLVEKFGEGLWRTIDDKSIVELTDQLCVQIDPNYGETKTKRYSSFADLSFAPRS